ncbi:O-linked N-acetylglucosamine transferase, SPINDLY family protein [Xanthobacter wiegelii]|uniref:O-linked N-acetylglucosamine transferase, SPINDLY family protein n=1 Tax=Xanthobacter wiegelii TaxID=3119913 RepID=UPI0037284147
MSQPPALPPPLAKLLYDGYQQQLRGQYEEAARAYRKILKSAPDHADVIQLLGICRARQGREIEAIELYRKALARRPDDAKCLYNLALAYGALKREAEEVAAMGEAFARDPSLPLAANVLFPARRATCDWRGHDRLLENLRLGATGQSAPSIPFLTLYIDDPALHLAAGRRWVEAERQPARPLTFDHSARRAATGPIRVAYVSADFRIHPTTHLIAGLLERHDRSRFEITAVSIGPDDGSPERARVKAAVDRFVDVEQASVEDIARQIAGLGIDIAVDLMTHTKGERMSLFAHRPAPVQVSFLGYPGTSGAPFFDYVIGDPVVLPFADAPFYSEKIVQLPHCYQPNDPDLPVGEPPGRAACGLPEDAFVFGAFNAASKLDPQTLSSFVRILEAVPGSVLWLLEGRPGTADNLRREAKLRGLDPARLVFAPRAELKEHLARIGHADLFLDTFPYTAHTTASDALRRGLPIVTRTGRSFASRVAESLMRQVNLGDLAVTTPAAFEDRAIALARDPAALAEVRARLQAALPGSPLFAVDRYARHIESAFETMAARMRAGAPPEAFAVPA